MVNEIAKGIPSSEGCVDVTSHRLDPINLITGGGQKENQWDGLHNVE